MLRGGWGVGVKAGELDLMRLVSSDDADSVSVAGPSPPRTVEEEEDEERRSRGFATTPDGKVGAAPFA
jgi:hypothetical protein